MSETLVKERPITFTDWSVQRIIAGVKTQTRRVIKPQPPAVDAVRAKSGDGYGWMETPEDSGCWQPYGPVWAVRNLMGEEPVLRCPHGKPGDRLWVREAWCHKADDNERVLYNAQGNLDTTCVHYRADGTEVVCLDDDGSIAYRKDGYERSPWKSPIFMPRRVSRLLLEVTDIRVERVQDISEADAEAEGIVWVPTGWQKGSSLRPLGDFYQRKWDEINAKSGFGWDTNPWVWVVEFRPYSAT